MPRRLHWYAWSPADYRADTRHLTRAQHFAYRETLDEIFLSGQDSDPPSIPDDSEFLSELWRTESELEYTSTRRALIESRRALLRAADGRIYQKRMSAEIGKALDVSDKRREAARTRWSARTETARHGANAGEAMATHAGNDNGSPKVSEKQFLFFAGRVGKWLAENRDFFHGSGSEPGSSFDTAFEGAIGISWKAWLQMREVHQKEQ